MKRRPALVATAALAMGAAALGTGARGQPSPAPRKLALVIGNARYPSRPLRTPLNDARHVAGSLRDLGFQVVHKANLDWDGMVQALGAFSAEAQRADVRVFYYAGHGMQIRSRNYLNPIGPVPANELELRSRSVDLDEMVDGLARLRDGLSVVVVDACRNNPFAAVPRPTRAGATQGLAGVEAPRGMLIAFSTGPNGTARDSLDGEHSPYTRRLLEGLRTPGLPIEHLFKKVHAAVDDDTARLQRPWLSSSLRGEFCLRPGVDGRCGGT